MSRLAEYLDVIEPISGASSRMPQGGRRLEFSRAEYARRYARTAALMEHSGVDAVVVAQPHSIRYFTGLTTWVWVLPPVMPVIAILPREPAQATVVDTAFDRGGLEAASWIEDFSFYGPGGDPIDAVVSALDERGLLNATIGFELGPGQRPNLNPNDLQRLLGSVRGKAVDASEILAAVRVLKGAEEIDRLREACVLSQIGFEAAFEAMRVGSTEAELTRVAAQAMLSAGARPGWEPFMLKFIAGPDRFAEHLLLSTSERVAAGQQLHADGGCAVDGYRCDFMRSAVIGRLPDDAEAAYELAVDGLAAAVSRLAPGRPLGEAWQAAADVFTRAGQPVGNSLTWGHGIGLEHWEIPQISQPGTPAGDMIARPGMVLCIEPTAGSELADGDGPVGTFIVEDQVVVTNEGVEVLTATLPRELFRAGSNGGS